MQILPSAFWQWQLNIMTSCSRRWGSADVLAGHSAGGLVVLGMADRLEQAATGGKQEKLAALGVPKQVCHGVSSSCVLAKILPQGVGEGGSYGQQLEQATAACGYQHPQAAIPPAP